MNIGFEAKRFFTNSTGLGNYSRFIVDALSVNNENDNFFLYTPSNVPGKASKEILNRRNVKVVRPSSTYQMFKAGSLWRTWGISQHPTIDSLNVFHGLSHELPIGLPVHIKKIVTVHDLIFLRYPQFYRQIDIWIYKSKLLHACRNADKIIAVSKQTASDLIEFLHVDEKKIEVVYQGCHSNFKRKLSAQEIEQVKIKHQLPAEYILNVGTVEERKNVLVLVKALAQIPEKSRLPLIIMGKHTPYYQTVVEEAAKLGVIKNIRFLNNIPFADFPAIYQGAKVFVYPSLFEGFGIPLVEAIESCVPVITSEGSCFIEAAGPSAKYINPKRSDELKKTLMEVLSDDTLRDQMIKGSTEYIQKFRPEVISSNLIKAYKTA
ncbi:glycosyltransferase family 4 protein [Chryseosolibacter indicus]|uniref:Glycosyltransferase family 4 protein n=1 Tax=Chryseosolibacter indicus TaxID=2782351 RepID=A0ABS5VJL4_9BACT|nr:glycosyltransferase family 1 protein [Chryseosolibacter indicus]MBT1701650.1 glycosyltransferase family 4 protein [Chryseosolibacter indicus]